jgi:hypothetical protein
LYYEIYIIPGKRDIEEILKKFFKEQQKQMENKVLFKAELTGRCLLFELAKSNNNF